MRARAMLACLGLIAGGWRRWLVLDLRDKTAAAYTADDCSFSVHPAASTDALGIDMGRIWAAVACPTLRDPSSASADEACQITTGFFVLENCLP